MKIVSNALTLDITSETSSIHQTMGIILKKKFSKENLNPILSIYFWQLKYKGSDPEELFLKNTCFLEKNEYTDVEKVCGVRTGSD